MRGGRRAPSGIAAAFDRAARAARPSVRKDPYRIRPDRRADLSARDTDAPRDLRGAKDEGGRRLERCKRRLAELQERLYADHSHALLVVLQGMDASGKDGTIRRVFEGVNPQGVRVVPFKAPTSEELDHDFLRRVHAQVPKKGEIVLFNRSHYEDVLVPRVHRTVARSTWERRYGAINDFERELADEGTTILKFFLHISRDEQKRRLKERLDDPTKHWKFRSDDVRERAWWEQYAAAYGEAIARTSTRWAPWYVVPADRKWYRDLVVTERLVRALEALRMRYPALPKEYRSTRIR
jgi:PPK2 family polyphosphate:nucleotide phosphotransferase